MAVEIMRSAYSNCVKIRLLDHFAPVGVRFIDTKFSLGYFKLFFPRSANCRQVGMLIIANRRDVLIRGDYPNADNSDF